MADIENDEDEQNELPSVEGLEERIKSSPDDLSLKEELVDALIDRYVYGEGENDPGNENDIKRVREILAELPETNATYPRAYIAYLDSKDKEAVKWLATYAKGSDPTTAAQSFSADELYTDIIERFPGASKEFWSDLATAIGELWPDTPSALTLAAYVEQDNGQLDDASDYYEQALAHDKNYWLAAWWLGDIHLARKNWQAAASIMKRRSNSSLPAVFQY